MKKWDSKEIGKWQNCHWRPGGLPWIPASGCTLDKAPDEPFSHLCLPTSCSSLRSKTRSRNTFCSGLLLWSARSEGPGLLHSGDEVFFSFYFPVSTQTQHKTELCFYSKILLHISDECSHHLFVISLWQTSQFSLEKGHCLPCLCWSFPLLTSTQLDSLRVLSTILTEKFLCPGSWAGPRKEFKDE